MDWDSALRVVSLGGIGLHVHVREPSFAPVAYSTSMVMPGFECAIFKSSSFSILSNIEIFHPSNYIVERHIVDHPSATCATAVGLPVFIRPTI